MLVLTSGQIKLQSEKHVLIIVGICFFFTATTTVTTFNQKLDDVTTSCNTAGFAVPGYQHNSNSLIPEIIVFDPRHGGDVHVLSIRTF